MQQTMLIAEGDAELCEHYRNFATEHGYKVEISSDGLDCMRKLRQVTPAVLVLDMELRWGGGDGVLGWLREEPKFLPGRVVLTATEAVPPHMLDGLAPRNCKNEEKVSFVKTLTKPIPLSALLDGPAILASDEPKYLSQIEAGRGQRRGILVVDDEPALREILQTYLQCEVSVIRIFGLVLLAVGVVLLIFGYNASQSTTERLVDGFTGRFTNETMMYLIGGVAAVVGGLGLALWGGRRATT